MFKQSSERNTGLAILQRKMSTFIGGRLNVHSSHTLSGYFKMGS